MELDQKIAELESRIDRLVRTQIGFQTEINALRSELSRLRSTEFAINEDLRAEAPAQPAAHATPASPPQTHRPRPPVRPVAAEPPGFGSTYYSTAKQDTQKEHAAAGIFSKYSESAKADLEKFIGENLISKIGILVLIIGVGIGVKYSIDNNLISPLARVILAYLFAFGLVALAVRLKPKYLNFSAALLSGGMAILYFVTYFAYSAYSLIGQGAAFGLMALFTVMTVAAALFFNRQVIAHIGLVGAYAVPFLLSSETGNYLFLFTYMAIINAGILAVSIQRYWPPLFYTASGFTWLIFFFWFVSRYSSAEHFTLGLAFLAAFFLVFFATRFVQTVVHHEHDKVEPTIGAAATAVVFYGFCFSISQQVVLTGQIWTLFAYLAVLTCALLAVSLRFVGKYLVYISFVSVWLIFSGWFLARYEQSSHAFPAAVFAAVFFSIFYGAMLYYRLITGKIDLVENAGLVLTNSFLFYGFGYSILNGSETSSNLLGAYTAGHSALHLGVAYIVGRLKPAADDVVQVLTILVLTFASIAIPVQFDGNQVTMIWSVEAALLFWFGRHRGVRLFELYSYPVMLLATVNMFLDWARAYFERTEFASEFNLQPIANGNFITALVYIASFAVIFAISRDSEEIPDPVPSLTRYFGYLISGLAVFVLYNAFRIEIGNYFHLQLVAANEAEGGLTSSIREILFSKNAMWQLNYSLLFLAAMAAVNLRKVRSRALGSVNVAAGLFFLLLAATAGMVVLYDLRVAYTTGSIGYSAVAIRYVTYLCSALLLAAIYSYRGGETTTHRIPAARGDQVFEAAAYGFTFIAASCELVNLMAQFGIPDAAKLGLSIFWGIYALALIVIGIRWNRKHLRIAAIVLLAVTLVKLFFYDVADLDTIPRTILFVTLGLTLLLISFLYNKYKNAIFGFAEESEEES